MTRERPKPPVYQPQPLPPADLCETFEEWVCRMVELGMTGSKEFQDALAFHGRPKLERIWRAHKASLGQLVEERELRW